MFCTADDPERPPRPFIICAFYTDGYADEIQSLKSSLEDLGLRYEIRRFDSRGTWEANTRIKPEFLLDCLGRHPDHDIVYIDADAVVRAPLTLFASFPADVGVFCAPATGGFSHRYLTGTLYLRNSPAVKAFVESWIKAQDGMVLGVDQDSFSMAVDKHPELALHPLPASYVKIYDRGSESPVIEHFQASRKKVKLARLLKRTRNTIATVAIIGLVTEMLLDLA